MSKKSSTKDTEHDDEKDLHDEEEDEGSDHDEEEERPAVAARGDRARRARIQAVDHDDHGHDDHDHDNEPETAIDEEEDPYWWAPHAVMSTLVLVGVLGFFGVFNRVLAPLAAHP